MKLFREHGAKSVLYMQALRMVTAIVRVFGSVTTSGVLLTALPRPSCSIRLWRHDQLNNRHQTKP